MSSEKLHEAPELMSERTKNMHRAIVSLMEELEAIDWYQQRADACSDEALKEILLHNKDEEIEHAMMTLEWLRRNDPVFAGNMQTYLFTDERIIDIEEEDNGGGGGPVAAVGQGGSLGIGSLR